MNSKNLTYVFAELRKDDTYLKNVGRKTTILNLRNDKHHDGNLHY